MVSIGTTRYCQSVLVHKMKVLPPEGEGGKGENILFEEVVARLKRQMENYYFSISQMIYNMEKLGG